MKKETEKSLKSLRKQLASASDNPRHSNHMADMAQDYSEQETLRNLITCHENTLTLILLALNRLNTHRYGICDKCGREIDDERLRVLPYALLCLKCQENVEEANRRPRRKR